MVIKDRIYGTYAIREKVILELLASLPLRRLAYISQMGPPDKYYHLENYSRLEHSVGVMLLLRHLGASLDEQIAGLIHDISHTAFSHVVDWVVGTGETEDYQDNHHASSPHTGEIVRILTAHGINPKKIVDFKRFPLLEQEIPDLCADRIDYALREFVPNVAVACFKNLTVRNGKIVFKNQKNARLFALSFLKRQMEHWGGYEAVTRYYYFAKVLKRALKLKLISWKSFSADEQSIIEKIGSSSDRIIRNLLFSLERKDLSNLPKMRNAVHKKFRYVDPLFLEKGRLRRLSDTDMLFVELLIMSKRDNDKGIRPGKISS